MSSGFIQIDNIPLNETERYREIILIMLEKGIFSLKNGHATLKFDSNGILQEIEVYQQRFRRKFEVLQNFEKSASIKTNNILP